MFRTRKADIVHNNTGASAIEFALVAPVFLLLLFGMIAYGIYLGAAHSVQQLAADAARISIAGLDRAERVELASNYISANSNGYMFLRADDIKVRVADSAVDPNQFEVAIDYYAHALPIWSLYHRSPCPRRSSAAVRQFS
jgi:Flp pilus assembly protein TadG